MGLRIWLLAMFVLVLASMCPSVHVLVELAICYSLLLLSHVDVECIYVNC